MPCEQTFHHLLCMILIENEVIIINVWHCKFGVYFVSTDQRAYARSVMQAKEDNLNHNQSHSSRGPSKSPSDELQTPRRTLLDLPTEGSNEVANEGYLDQSLESADRFQAPVVSMNPAGADPSPAASPDTVQNPNYVPDSPTLRPNLPFPGQPYQNPKS